MTLGSKDNFHLANIYIYIYIYIYISGLESIPLQVYNKFKFFSSQTGCYINVKEQADLLFNHS